jgi:ABC-2 type transport system permease protein
MVILAMSLFGMRPPSDPGSAVGFAIVMIGTLAMSCAITVLVGITLMWTVSGEGIVQLLPSVVTLLSGMLVPIPLFPEWAQPILEFLPFKALVDAPYRVYLGNIPIEELGRVVFHQWVWIAILILGGRALLKRGLKRMVVQGG